MERRTGLGEVAEAVAARAPEGWVTLLFSDIVGSTEIKQRAGETEADGNRAWVAGVLAPHDRIVRDAAAQTDGFVVKTLGDAFFLSFAEARGALACAVLIQEGLAGADLRTPLPGKPPLEVRIGIPTGRPLRQGEDYQGTAVDKAARVQGLAGGGQIVVSEETLQEAGRGPYRWKAWPHRRIKSFARPETVHELLWDGRERAEPGTRWVPEWFRGERNRFIPRPGLEQQVLEMFAEPEVQLVTLCGFGGMGKTRLGVQCAVQAAGAFRDGAKFVRLEGCARGREAVSEAIGQAVGRTGAEGLPEALLGWLREREVLLLLDNFESVEDDEAAGFLDELLERAAGVRLLVTSRKPVGLDLVEQRVSLDGGMEEAEARALFRERARLKNRDWEPDDEASLRTILELTERIPLALELAAAWTEKRTLAEIAEGLRETPLGPETGLPGRGGSQLPGRHHSLTRCIQWSYDWLTPEDQTRFAALGVFGASFTAEAAAAVLELPVSEVRELLDRLLEVSLLFRLEMNGRSRYQMRRPVRAFADACLDEQPEARAVRERYVAYYERLVLKYGGHSHQLTAERMSILDAEWRGAVAAAVLAKRLELWHSVQEIAWTLAGFLSLRGSWGEWESLAQQAVLAARAAGNQAREGETLNNLGIAYRSQGQWAKAEAALQGSLAIRRKFGDRVGEGQTLNNLGNVYRNQGQWVKAEAAYQESLAICRELGNRIDEGRTVWNQALLREQQGELREALQDARQAVAVLEETESVVELKRAREVLARLEGKLREGSA